MSAISSDFWRNAEASNAKFRLRLSVFASQQSVGLSEQIQSETASPPQELASQPDRSLPSPLKQHKFLYHLPNDVQQIALGSEFHTFHQEDLEIHQATTNERLLNSHHGAFLNQRLG